MEQLRKCVTSRMCIPSHWLRIALLVVDYLPCALIHELYMSRKVVFTVMALLESHVFDGRL